MPQDIRSFFTVVSKKNTAPSSSTSAKKRSLDESDDEDFVSDTPEAKRPDKKKKKKVILSSDSEDESKSKSKAKPKPEEKKESKKVVSALDMFGSTPVKQSKVEKINKSPAKENGDKPDKKKSKDNSKSKKEKKKVDEKGTELGIHDDDDFEKTLLELDDDVLLNNIDELEKSIQETKSSKTEDQNDEVGQKSESKPKTNDNPKKSHHSSSDDKTPNKKRKVEELDSTMDPDEERYERRRQSSMLYQKYLQRGGPEHHGQKELPKGKPTCLQNLCFLRTGVLDSLENDEFDSLIKEHGGRTVHSVSKKVNYLVIGKEPGPAKMAKAENFGIPMISEDELLDLILTKSGMEPKYVKKESSEETKKVNGSGDKPKKEKDIKSESKSESKKSERSPEKRSHQKKDEKKSPSKKEDKSPGKPNLKKLGSLSSSSSDKKDVKIKADKDDDIPSTTIKREKQNDDEIPTTTVKKEKQNWLPSKSDSNKVKKEHPKIVHSKDLPAIDKPKIEIDVKNVSWTEKYKPLNCKGIIGQQGDSSNMKKLTVWLQNWHKYHSGKDRPKLTRPFAYNKNDTGSYFKCALLSGPPGVGKTTTATLVAKELGFDVVEFNASDTRSKRLLQEEVSQLLSTTSLAGFFKDGSAPTKKHVLLMDEVDGMAGNEDRGGIQELINLIKASNVPIICMCNDRNHNKVRSLANYCFDLRFARPRLEQIRGAMMTVCCREGINIKPDALTQVITGAGMDIRQVLNNLSVWTAGKNSLDASTAEKEANSAKKDTILGPWEVCRKVFSKEEHKNMSIADRSRLFFYDYSIAPLFVQENYLEVVPSCPEKDILKRVAATADSLSMSDVVDKKIRNTNNWSLLEVQAMYASVLPGHYMEGYMGGQINFPGWLGQNSKRGRFQRLLCELQAHMRTCISGSKQAVNLDYIYHLRNKIVRPLVKDGTAGVDTAVDVMNTYHLKREDLDSLIELSQWPDTPDPMRMVDSKVKTAFTRAYNKKTLLPYAVSAVPVKKRAAAGGGDEGFEDVEELSDDNQDDDDLTKDAMIKEKKKPPPAKAKKEPAESTSKKGGSTSKGKGKKK